MCVFITSFFFLFLSTFYSHSASYIVLFATIMHTQFSDRLDSKFYSPRSTLELNNKGNTLRSEFVDATNRMERYLFLFFKNNEEWKWNKITVRTNWRSVQACTWSKRRRKRMPRVSDLLQPVTLSLDHPAFRISPINITRFEFENLNLVIPCSSV